MVTREDTPPSSYFHTFWLYLQVPASTACEPGPRLKRALCVFVGRCGGQLARVHAAPPKPCAGRHDVLESETAPPLAFQQLGRALGSEAAARPPIAKAAHGDAHHPWSRQSTRCW